MCPNFTTRNWDASWQRSLRCRVAPSADLYWWSSYFGCSSTSDRCGSATKILWGKQASNEARAGTRHTSTTILLRFCQRNYICRFERWSVCFLRRHECDLEVRFADETPTKSPEESFTPEVAFSSCSSEVTCQGCKKQLKIQETDSGQLKKQEKVVLSSVQSFHSLNEMQ